MDYDDDSSLKFTDKGTGAQYYLAGYFQDNKNIVLIGDDVRKKLDDHKETTCQRI